ncbi:MAG: histidine phosphatase family protein [Lachnospiraceae bacterium]
MLEIVFIRHSKTAGNLQGRYIGTTDEPLCNEGKKLLKSKYYPQDCEKVYSSPMKRCVETVQLIYPGIPVELVDDLRELDFGIFENKNYAELNGNPAYQAWVDSNGTDPIPGGELRSDFVKRCVEAFEVIVRDAEMRKLSKIVIVAHGGTLMSILSALAVPKEDYYYWRVKNGEGFITEYSEKALRNVRTLW